MSIPIRNGLILVDKPAGLTSHDVVNHLRRILNTRRIGHTGILDPNATGLLLMLIERGTLLSSWLTGMPKRYIARFAFGMTTDTYDADGEITSQADPGILSREDFQSRASQFSGEFEQKIPPYSAVKRQGKKFYKLARKGSQFNPGTKVVEIKSMKILDFSWPEAVMDIECSSGTYIRSLAQQLGIDFGCGGYLKALRRIEVGPFKLSSAAGLDEIMSSKDPESFIRPLKAALPSLPAVKIRDQYCGAILGGRPLLKKYFEDDAYSGNGDELSLLLDRDEKVLALAQLNLNWRAVERLAPTEVMGAYVRVIDEGHIRDK
jgi:tRNA pseudouridine55 synthase